jgi:hypothetical protein
MLVLSPVPPASQRAARACTVRTADDNCLDELYPPGSCGTFCNDHTYSCFLDEVHEACCDEGGRNCVEGNDVPLTCPVGCAIVFPEFVDICREHITATGLAIVDFEAFEQACLDLDGLALVDYVVSLKSRGCVVDVDGWAGAAVTGGGHRRSLSEFFASHFVAGDPGCAWDELDDLIHHVGEICCVDTACAETGNPASCMPTCAIAMHTLMQQCGPTIERLMGADAMQSFSGFEAQCFDEADPSIFMMAIEHAHCPEDDPVYRIFVGSANDDNAVVASIADANQISLNGVAQGILQAGELWEGTVSSGDVFSATAAIYGIVRSGHGQGDRAMSPEFLRGTEFAVANSRRASAHLYMNCVDAPCSVTVSTNDGVVATQDIEPNSFSEIVVEGASGAGKNNGSSEPFIYKNDHFTKTGSGQTFKHRENSKKTTVLCNRPCHHRLIDCAGGPGSGRRRNDGLHARGPCFV